MNEEESLALFAQGQDAWNAWAAEMIAKREVLEAAGQWTAHRDDRLQNDATRAWREAAKAEFSRHDFEEDAGFSGFVFPGQAVFAGVTFPWTAGFYEATFLGDAMFLEGTFSGPTVFSEATFSGVAYFQNLTFSAEAEFVRTTFSDSASFHDVTFSGPAVFPRAKFSGETAFFGATFSFVAEFDKATFSGLTEFHDVTFEDSAYFRAMESKSTFSLARSTFRAVPDFTQAQFAQTLRFDDFRIEPRGLRRPTNAEFKNFLKGDRALSIRLRVLKSCIRNQDHMGNRTLALRWQALKRLALQGQDHLRALEFFQNEMRARRWSTDRPWHAVLWLGLLYGWLSSFGRSIVRPLIWWAASVLLFAPLYLAPHLDRTGEASSAFGHTIDRLLLEPFGAAATPALDCLAGQGDPWRAALGISAQKALLFFGPESGETLTQNYACLFGVTPRQPVPPGQPSSGFFADVPNSVIVLGIVQQIVSAALLFLVLLATRNHFRAK